MRGLLVRILVRLIVLILTPVIIVLELLKFAHRPRWHETRRRGP